jgi:hypothetical protein
MTAGVRGQTHVDSAGILYVEGWVVPQVITLLI